MIQGNLTKEGERSSWIDWLCALEGHEFLIAVDVKFVKLVVSSEDYEEVRGIWRQRYNRYEDAI